MLFCALGPSVVWFFLSNESKALNLGSLKSNPLRKPFGTNAGLCLGMFGFNLSGWADVWSGANMSKSAMAQLRITRLTATRDTMAKGCEGS